jgi:hypothetical protein
MNEQFFIRTNGGPHPGTRVANTPDGVQMDWPPPDELPDEGGVYVKTTQSNLPPIEPEKHVMRGAQYEWRPDDQSD